MMDIKRLFQIPLIFLLIPLFFLVMLIKIYILCLLYTSDAADE